MKQFIRIKNTEQDQSSQLIELITQIVVDLIYSITIIIVNFETKASEYQTGDIYSYVKIDLKKIKIDETKQKQTESLVS